jgi:hypothetical protein
VLIFKDVAPLRRLSTLAGELLTAAFGEAPARARSLLSGRRSSRLERARW